VLSANVPKANIGQHLMLQSEAGFGPYAKRELSFRDQSAAVELLSASPQRLLPPSPA
jgi:hypothetical protein